jgi:UDP-N-acetyl-D-mannosaminuronic acid dehydrogenase
VDVWRIRDLVNKVPFRDMHRPGGGVGGHCLPKDSWLLAAAARHTPIRVISSAREVNDAMPLYLAEHLADRLGKQDLHGSPTSRLKVAILGYSYLPESDDVRNTPSQVLLAELTRRGFAVKVHDPFIPEYAGPVEKTLEGCVAVIVMVAHKAYDDLLLDSPIVIRAGSRA